MSIFQPALILFALGVLSGAVGGWTARKAVADADKTAALQALVQKAEAARERTETLAHAQTRANAEQSAKDRVITKEVIRYVDLTPQSDRCTLPPAWRMRHDAAATGDPDVASGMVADPPAPVTDATALETVADNYLDCRAAIRQVKGWQDWCQQQDWCRQGKAND